jgi:hypothetical protein
MRAMRIWALLALAWGGGVAAFAVKAWPHVPLDMSRADPATVAALYRAIVQHASTNVALALLPPLLVLALGWLVQRRSGARLTAGANTGTNKT